MLQLSSPPAEQPSDSDPIDPAEAAALAGLRYVQDVQPGLRRRRAGKGFFYLDPKGKTLRDPETLSRLKALAIPPAWTDVWICPDPRGHLQATGFDARGRKQYRYHPRWREVRDAVKYDRMLAFGEALPRMRERTDKDLTAPGLPREKVLAAVVQLLGSTLIRIGNEEYLRENRSYGLTTLRKRHAEVVGSRVRFQFRGKGGKEHSVQIANRRLAAVVKRCQELPGQELFRYVDEGGVPRAVESGDVNAYLREISDGDFTAKDFRTWAGSVLAASALRERDNCETQRDCRKRIASAIEQVARQLGNTPAVCRRCYVHPAVIAAYEDGTLLEISAECPAETALDTLSEEERLFLNLLRRGAGPTMATQSMAPAA